MEIVLKRADFEATKCFYSVKLHLTSFNVLLLIFEQGFQAEL